MAKRKTLDVILDDRAEFYQNMEVSYPVVTFDWCFYSNTWRSGTSMCLTTRNFAQILAAYSRAHEWYESVKSRENKNE